MSRTSAFNRPRPTLNNEESNSHENKPDSNSLVMQEVNLYPSSVNFENETETYNPAQEKQDLLQDNAKVVTERTSGPDPTEVLVVQTSSMGQYSVPIKSPNIALNKSFTSNCSGPVCRICHEGDCVEELISPCDCMGSMTYVHICCIEKWLSTSNSDRCEVCKFQFKTRRTCRPVLDWLCSSRSLDGPRGFCGDALCLILLTPICLTSVYLCGMGSMAYLHLGAWEGIGLAFLSLIVFITFFLWGFTTIRFHWQSLQRWRHSNQLVTLVDHNHQRRRRVESQGNCNARKIVPVSSASLQSPDTPPQDTTSMHI